MPIPERGSSGLKDWHGSEQVQSAAAFSSSLGHPPHTHHTHSLGTNSFSCTSLADLTFPSTSPPRVKSQEYTKLTGRDRQLHPRVVVVVKNPVGNTQHGCSDIYYKAADLYIDVLCWHINEDMD